MDVSGSLNSAAAAPSELPFELESLSRAYRYQRWVADAVSPYWGRRILELGAGVGNLSQHLPVRDRLILTEMEPALYARLSQRATEIATEARAAAGVVSVQPFDLANDSIDPLVAEGLDTIISFNVLEHIENDRAALRRLVEILKRGGAERPRRLVTFVPAHQWAYGTMDKAFGHHRRYTAAGFRRLAEEVAPGARVTTRYFNTFGLVGWVLTGRILRRSSIGLGSIHLFEALCPVIRPIDDAVHRIF